MKTSDFYYDLPERLIAQTPIEPRDHSRLLRYDISEDKVTHGHFYDIINILNDGDLLVVNNTKVYPARVYAKTLNGGKMEILLLKRINYTDWEVLVKPGKKARDGSKFTVCDQLSFEVLSHTDAGGRIIRFYFDGVFEDILSNVGEMPLPHYIKEKLDDQSRYQTVYCKTEGSAAAPTAGLHFTPELMDRLREKGINFGYVTLHVGLGTFRPVKAEEITDHHMHSEHYELPPETAELIRRTKAAGKRVIAVGTTSCRTLESVASFHDGRIEAADGYTDIFIYPGYQFKVLDGLITNFHLPESTLIMLVSAFMGYEHTMEAYRTAVEEQYRFFSFGDAMFIG